MSRLLQHAVVAVLAVGGLVAEATVSRAPRAQAPSAVQRPPTEQPTPPATLPSPKSGTAHPTVAMTPETIRQVRQLFYDRGYPVTRIDTFPGSDLQRAIQQLQSEIRQSINGALTVAQLEHLEKVPTPAAWGAIAYTARGGNVGVAGRPTRARAEEEAKADCAKRAGSACDVLTVSGKQCVALGFNLGIVASVKTWLTTSGYGDDPVGARQAAMGDCLDRAKLRENCEVRRVVCADGRADTSPPAKGKAAR